MDALKVYEIPIEFLPMNVAIYRRVDDDYVIVDFNKMACETENLKREDILGKALCEVFPNVKEFGLFEVLEKVEKNGGHETFDLNFYKDAKSSGWRKNEVIKLPNGEIMVVYEDLKQNLQAQEDLKLKLQESQDNFRILADSTLLGIFIYTEHFVYVNQAMSDMSGYSKEEFLTMTPWEIATEPAREPMKKIISRRLKGEKFPIEYSDLDLITKSGKIKTARVLTETIKYKSGYAGLGTIVDITDIKETKQKLKMLAQAIEQTDELVMITDKSGVITYVNDAYVAHTGYKHSEFIGKKPSLINSKTHSSDFFKEMWETILAGKTYTNTVTNRAKNGKLYYEEVTITPIFDDNNTLINFISTGRDITERIKMENELQMLATTDSLTGIYNRYRGNDILDLEVDRAYRYSSPLAVLMFDVDNFKNVNDVYGHDIGDYVLKKLSEIVSTHMRKSDAFIRWGGEEFIIVAANIDKREAMEFAEKLRVAVASYIFDQEMRITISFGVTIFKTSDTKMTILKRVDKALYKAKEDGRNCTRYL